MRFRYSRVPFATARPAEQLTRSVWLRGFPLPSLLREWQPARNTNLDGSALTIRPSPASVRFLPFTLPVQKNFEYASATQGTFSVEHQLSKDMTLSASYLFVGAHHLPHPLDVNARESIYRWRTSRG